MQSFMRVAVPGILAALLLLVSLQNRALRDLQRRTVRTASSPHPGFVLPPLSLPDVSGRVHALGQPAPGRFQLLFAFTETCDYCRASYPVVAALAESLASDSLYRTDLIGIALDQQDTVVHQFLIRQEPHYPVAKLPARWQRHFRFSTVPALVLVDSSGAVLYSHIGTLTPPRALDSLFTRLRESRQLHQTAYASPLP